MCCKVLSVLSPFEWQVGKQVFKNLVVSKKFDDSQVNRRVKTQAAFIRSQRAFKFDPESAVDMYLILVVVPGNPKYNLSFGFAYPFNYLLVSKFRIFFQKDRKSVV